MSQVKLFSGRFTNIKESEGYWNAEMHSPTPGCKVNVENWMKVKKAEI